MLAQLASTLGALQLPLRISLPDGESLDLAQSPTVELRIRDPALLAELQRPTLDALGEAYIEERLDIHGPLPEAMAIADRLSQSLVVNAPGDPPA